MTNPRVLNGRYELGVLLGRGGMADVYKARDIRLGRTVAVKLLRADLARDPQLQARFRREAKAVAGLNHPSIVAVYDTGEHDTEEPLRDGTRMPFIVMELVTGRTLRELIRAGEVTVDHAIDYTLGVLSALEYSHRAGIVHRDIKPANVMVVQGSEDAIGAVKVMDFGIARTLSDNSSTMTQTQAVLGTAQYLSPEQALGETVDERSDLYSAACLFYEMLAGRPPFLGDSPVSVAYQHVREPPAPPSIYNPKVSPALDSVLMRALQKARGDRFQDAAAFRRALRAAKAGVPLAPVADNAATGAATEIFAPIAASEATVPVETVNAPPAAEQEADDGGPATRAMARALAGGALTTDNGAPDDTDTGPDKATKRRRRAWIVTLFVFLVLILCGGGVLGYNWLNAESAPPPQVQIPSVAKLSETSAIIRLQGAGFSPSIEHPYDSKVPKGLAMGTDPATGSMVAPHSELTLLVSNGPASQTIPKSLVRETESQARDDINALGLVAGDTSMVDDPLIPRGMVVTTAPAPGQVVGTGSTVNLKVSTGQVVMPALFGDTKDEAQKAVTKASSTLSVIFEETVNAVVPAGNVTGQSTAAGTEVDQYSTITVQIAKAPPPAPKPKPTPKPTPSPTPTPTSTACSTGSDAQACATATDSASSTPSPGDGN